MYFYVLQKNITMIEALEPQLAAKRAPNDPINDSIAQRKITYEIPKAGETAPLFLLPDENGNKVLLEDLIKKGPVILSFFKGNWCEVCDLELRAHQRALPEFKKYGATLVAISPHTISVSYQLKSEKELTYCILSDSGNEIANLYGLRFEIQKPLLDAFASFGLDFTQLHGDQGENTGTLPIPGTFVIGVGGRIIYSFVDSDHTKRAEPADIVAVLMTK